MFLEGLTCPSPEKEVDSTQNERIYIHRDGSIDRDAPDAGHVDTKNMIIESMEKY